MKKEINCCLPGIVQGFNAAAQTIDVELGIKRVVDIALDGTKTIGEYPLLVSCPVMILSGGPAHITFPIAAGDSCIVLFNDREIENWYLTGTPQAPTTGRLHDKSDAFAIVGIRNTQNAIANYFEGTEWAIDGTTKIQLTSGLVHAIGTSIKLEGNVEITGTLFVDGETGGTSGSGTMNISSNLVASGKTIQAGIIKSDNGATGSGTHVTVANGIVTAVS